ncbi:MAG TPA: hypothetical protein VGM87_00910 [Roseomonas sp.]|jgi:hypothetical protein
MTPSLRLDALFDAQEAQEKREQDAARRLAAEAAAKQELERQHFDQRPLTDADKQFFLRRIHTEFEHHEREALLASFPSDYCSDSGRHINHHLDGWEETLPGYARRIHDFWHADLRLGGFGFSARIISFSHDMMPQDVGLFVTWPEVRG